MTRFPMLDVEAKRELGASSNELLNALWTNYTDSIALYQANPTAENWHLFRRAYAMFRIAFVADNEPAHL